MKSRGHPNDCGCELHKAAPMPTLADLWKAQFCNHIFGLLTLDGQGWEPVKAQRAAMDEFDALDGDTKTGDPIEAANECMSYWDCEPDFSNDAFVESAVKVHGALSEAQERHLDSDAATKPAPTPCEMCGDAPCQGCNKCCGSKLGRDPEDGSCLGCG